MLGNPTTRIIGYWQPHANMSDQSPQNQKLIGEQFKQYVGTLGFKITIQSVHHPSNLIKWVDNVWHQDCNGIDASFLVWSNIQPTEIMFLSDGHLLEVNDGAVILVINTEVKHRTPFPVDPTRWLVRSNYIQ